MSLSQLASSIAESPTLKLNEEAAKLREKGESVIHLGIGEPKNKTPINAIISSASRLNSGDVKYTPSDGIPSLKKAIIRYTEESYDKLVAPQNVIVTSGAKQALYNILYTILNPQDEVIIPAPYWVSYPEMVKMVYGTPVFVKPEDGGVYPHMSEIEEAVSPYTRAMIINSPNNPSGVIYPPEFVSAVVDFCERKNIWLIMDDIYHKLVFDGRKAPSVFDFARRTGEDSVIVAINGVSKLYAMTGFRIGWAVTTKRMVGVMKNVQAQILSCPSALAEAAALGALTGDQSCVETLRSTLEHNRDVMVRELATIPRVKLNTPGGTFYSLPDFSAYDNNSHRLSAFLLDKVMVAGVPGKDFGAEGHIRLSYCGAESEIIEGVARIRWALDPSSPRETVIGSTTFVKDW